MQKTLKTKTQIKKWLDKYNVKDYIINDDLTVDVNDFVNLSYKRLTEIPIQFGTINGYFDCRGNHLNSLKGCPKAVKGFNCSFNKLTSLKYCPKVTTWFNCFNNKLVYLDYLPILSGYLECDESLHDTPEYKKYLILQALRK